MQTEKILTDRVVDRAFFYDITWTDRGKYEHWCMKPMKR